MDVGFLTLMVGYRDAMRCDEVICASASERAVNAKERKNAKRKEKKEKGCKGEKGVGGGGFGRGFVGVWGGLVGV